MRKENELWLELAKDALRTLGDCAFEAGNNPIQIADGVAQTADAMLHEYKKRFPKVLDPP